MQRLRSIRPLAALMLTLLALAGGCAESESDSEQISATVERAFTENDPALCAELLTGAFIKAFYGTLEECEKNAQKGSDADSVDVLQVSVKADAATALIRASGGSASPEPRTLRLIKEDGSWKIDGVAGRMPPVSG